MRFFRQTLPLVCLLLPCALLAQPVATPDNATTPEDIQIDFVVVDNDIAAPNTIDPATVDLDSNTPAEDKIVGTPEGTFEVDGSGTVTFTPTPDFFGDAITSYTVKDDIGQISGAALITVHVTSVNDAPTISSIGGQTILENTQTSLLGFTVGDVESLPADLTVTPASGDLTLVPLANIDIQGTGAARTVQITPATNEVGSAQITLTVDDGEDNTPTMFTLTVNANTPPTISSIADQVIVENMQTSVLAFTVGDAESLPTDLTVTPASGDLTLVPLANIDIQGTGAARTVQITPAANEVGTAQITLTVSDGEDDTPMSFILTVNAPNTPPTITSISDLAIPENTQTTLLDFTVGDAESLPADLTVTPTSGNLTLVPLANIDIQGSGAARTVQITPAANEVGTAQITLTVSDGEDDTPMSFVLTVTAPNTPPTITSISNLSTNEDTATPALAFTIGDAETSADLLMVTGTSSNQAVVADANVVISGTNESRTVVVTPQPNQSGPVTITLTVSDGDDNTQTTFILNIDPVNDAPTISSIDDLTIFEDTQTAALPFTIGDVETSASLLIVSAMSSSPTLVLPGGIVLSGSGAARNITITPAPNEFGNSTITLQVSDGTATTQTTFILMVTGVNDTPTISSISDQIIPENTQTGVLPFTIGDVETPAASLMLTPVSSNTVLVSNSNVVLGGSGSLRNVNVIPTLNQFGMTLITLTVSDGAKTAQTAFQVTVTAVDTPPTITPILDQVINEDGSTGPLAFTIGDDGGLAGLTVSATSNNQTLIPNGNIILVDNGLGGWTVQVNPAANQNSLSPVLITITVDDAVEMLQTQTSFSVTVNAVNDVPVFTKGSNPTVNEDAGAQSIAGWATGIDDGDPELSQSLTFNIVLNSNAALFSVQPAVSAGGTLTFTPAAGANGFANIDITLSDNGSGSAPNVNTTAQQSFTINVTAINDAPSFTKGGNQNVLEDAGAQSVPNWATAISNGDPGSGQTVSFNVSNDNNALFSVQPAISPTGTLTYTPAANAFGTAVVTVTLSDDGLSSPPPNVNTSAAQNFNIDVTAVNDLPTITTITDQNINEDGTTGALGFTVGDVETPAASLTVTKSSSNPAVIPNANVVVSGAGAARTVTVTPAANQFGFSDITLNVNDGTATVPMTFRVNVASVNDAPTITNIATQVIDENTSTGALAFTVGDVETPVGSLTVSGSSDNTTVVPNGNIVFGGAGAGRTVTVTPAANQNGIVMITVNVSDGSATTPMTFQLTINAVDDPPTISAIPTQTIFEDTQTGNIAFTISDPETPAGSLIVTATSSNTTLVPTGNISLGGSGANRTINVTPVANLFGSTTITINVSDGVNTTQRPFLVNVTSVNDVPTVSTIGNQTIDEGTSTGALAFTIGDIETAPGSLIVTRASNNLTLVPLANVVLGGSGANRTVTVTPAVNQFGIVMITINVSDGTDTTPMTFQVTVTEVNDPPTITSISNQTVNEDNPTAALAFTIGDPETPAGSLTLTGSSSNTTLVPNVNITFGGSGAARTVTVTPDLNQNGSTLITVNVSDGVNTTSTNFTLNVTAVNDAPTISAIADQIVNEDNATGNISFTIGDVETAAGSLTVTATSSNTTLVPNGNITLGGSGISRTINITPAANQSGFTNITINVSDGVLTTPRIFKVTVNPVNDVPTISAIANQSINEDGTTGALSFTISDVETPAGSLTVTASSSNTPVVPSANVVLGGSGSARTVTVTPAPNAFGVTTITLTVSDGTATAQTTFDVTVIAVDDPPTITSISDRIINEDSQTGTIPFTISDPETAAAALVVTGASSNPAIVPNANVVIAGSGATRTVNVIPAADQFGIVNITLTVSDGVNNVPTTFKVTINAVNDAPVITNQVSITINEVQPVNLLVTQLTIVDPDNVYPGDFTLFVLGGPNYSVVGSTVTPIPNFSGTLTVPVFVSDGLANSNFYNVQISVNSTNDPPVITGQKTLTILEDQTIALSFGDLTVEDPDNPYPTGFSMTVLPGPNYTFTGTTITPALNFNGTLVVSVKVNDGELDSQPYSLQITITPVNDPPVITAQSPLSTNEDTPITLVIGNFTVVDPEPTTYTLTVVPGAGPNFTVSGNTVTPNANYFGTISVPVRVSDGFLNSIVYNAQIQVNSVNDPPVIIGQTSLSTVEDIPITILLTDLTVTDVDNPGYPTGFALNVLAGTNYTFSGATVTPSANVTGTIFVNVRVNDGTDNSNTYPLQVEVTPAEDAPEITGQHPVTMDEDNSRTILVSDLIIDDPDTPDSQQTLTVLSGTNYTFVGNTITPSPNFFGTLSVNVRVNDGTAFSNTFPLQVTVNPVNDDPSFSPIANVTILEDATLQSVIINNISPGPLESPQQVLITIVSDNTSLIPQPVISPAYNGTATMANLTFKPEPNMFGTATITVTVVDTELRSFAQTFTITVTPVNDAPTLDPIALGPIDEDAPLQTVTLTGISPGGGPLEASQTLSFILATNKPELFDVFEIVPVKPTGSTASLRIKPAANAHGTATITVTLNDSGPGSPAPNVNFVIRTFTLVINSVNDLPFIESVEVTLAEVGVLYEYDIVVTDADGDVITISVPTKPAWLTVTQGTNGKAKLSGTAPMGTTGSVDIVINAKDQSNIIVAQAFTLFINSRPVLSPITIALDEDVSYTFALDDFANGFTDADGNPLAELQITKLPKKGNLKLNGTAIAEGDKIPAASINNLTYTPLADSTGTDTLWWTAADGFQFYALESTYAVFTIAPSNDPPVITFLETDSLKYELGSEVPVLLTPKFDAYDPDGDDLISAELGFLRPEYSYDSKNDRLIFQSTPKITGTFDPVTGALKLNGRATPKEYVAAIRTIKYNYIDAKEILFDPRGVSFVLTDVNNTVSQARVRIIKLIYTFSDLDIPTAFTPNGDMANETWLISSTNGLDQYSNAEINVYNKRGLLLFHTKGFEVPWNGVFNGEVLPPDTYFYTIDLKYNKVRYKGTVTILR